MTWRLQVTHTTKYRYSAPVAQSYNEARLEPRSDRHQAVLASRVEVEPSTRVVRHVDYWGSVVHHFDVQVPHQALTVVGRATVETATELAQVGGTKDPDIAAIVALAPDLVVLCEEENRREDADALASAIPDSLAQDVVDLLAKRLAN